MNQKSKEPTPEERLFKLIQDGEKSEASEETLVVSSGAGAVASRAQGKEPKEERRFAEVSLETLSEDPQGSQDHAVRLKKVNRAINAHKSRIDISHWASPKNFFSVKTAVRGLAIVLVVLVIHLGVNYPALSKLPSAEFMKKANAAGDPPLEAPQNLFSAPINPDLFPKRNIFQPYRPEPVSAPATPVKAADPGSSASLTAQLATLRLSGIFINGDKMEALVEVVDEKKTYAVKEGSLVKGLTVKKVKQEGIVFTDGSAEQMLQ